MDCVVLDVVACRVLHADLPPRNPMDGMGGGDSLRLEFERRGFRFENNICVKSDKWPFCN